MNVLFSPRFPEVILAVAACVLFLLGTSTRVLSRKLSANIALLVLLITFCEQCWLTSFHPESIIDAGASVHTQPFSEYIKLITTGMGVLLVLLNMPTNREGTGGSASNFGGDTAEFFGLMLLSLAGLCVVASANDLMLLFLGIELASFPTYIMVSISRPIPVAQEAGLKYFFLGAMSAAIMLFGFSYLYGTTGSTSLDQIAALFSTHGIQSVSHTGTLITTFARGNWTDWQILAVLLLIGGFAFKMAAVPLHSYAGDVYQGAATPVTAFLSFVPKTAGFVALIKVLYAVGGYSWAVPEVVEKTLWAIAALTMTFGNILGLLQFNIKRTLAYSSVAHTGYMLVGITALVSASQFPRNEAMTIQSDALQGVLFYLAAYGITNVAAFGVLQLLPSRHNRPATSAETFEDIAGQGRKHVALGLAMSVACLSLTGIPLTVGFLGKIYLTLPAAHANLIALSILLWINAAISAAYYLRIIVSMFLRSEPAQLVGPTAGPLRLLQPASVVLAVMLSAILTLLLGTFIPATKLLTSRITSAAKLERGQDITIIETATAWGK